MKRKIKIVYMIDAINSVAGTEKQLLQMLQHLNKELFDAKLICLRKPSGTFITNKSTFEYIVIGLDKLLSFKALPKLIWLISYFRKENIDILQTYFFDATVIGVLAGKVAGVKKIISCRRDLGFWYTPKLLMVLKIINRFTTRILANSYAVKEHVAKHEHVPMEKIDVIKNGIDLNLFIKEYDRERFIKETGISNGDYIVGIVSNLNRPIKRVDMFLKAAAEVLQVIPTVSFMILGDGYLIGELKGIAENLGISEKIFFIGRKNEIHSIIACWDIGVISSDSEGFSNSILEYMASGLPVVATAVGGNKELIEDGVNGVLVSPGDHKSMAEKICILIKDRRSRLQMGKKGLLTVQKDYVWNAKIKEIEGYYHSLIINKKTQNY